MKDKVFSKSSIEKMAAANNVQQFEDYQPNWINMAEVIPKNQPWFWPGMIPLDAITLFGGVGGIGKSLLLLYLAAKTTTGEEFNAGGLSHRLPVGSVILLSAEDDAEYHIMPKLIAAGAIVNKIHLIKSKIGSLSKKNKFLELDKDLHILEQKISEMEDVKFIIIDPVTYFIGDIRDNYSGDVANFLQNINDLAKKYNISVVLNKHRRKQANGSRGAIGAADEIGGAGAWTNTPRRCWMITDSHDDPTIKLITKMKDNIGKRTDETLGFKIEKISIEYDGEKIETTQLVWLDKMQHITAEEAINKDVFIKGKTDQAIDFFFDYLNKNGQSRLKSIQEASAKFGFSERTFERALEEIKAKHAHKIIKSRGMKGAIIYQLGGEY